MNNPRGALLMVVSMALFALEDMFLKLASAAVPVGQILTVLGTGGFLLFAAAVALRRQALFPAELFAPVILLRNVGELIGTFGFVTALALTPISSASAILQALPLAVTMLAALWLGETVGWRRWTAICVGFLGVLLIVRPGSSAFQPASLFAVLAVLALAVRDLSTRIAPQTMSSLQIAQWAYAMVIPLGLLMLALGDGPRPVAAPTALQLVAILVIGMAGYYTLVVALRIADISAVAPFRYARLVFALVIGVTVFSERPDTLTLAGISLIIGSGLYALARERALFSRARQG